MELLSLLIKTITLRPYVFMFLGTFLILATRFIGWRRAGYFLGITWVVAFASEFSSTRTGVPFGLYHYTGSSASEELYLSNIPFMDSLSFPFLLYASYCMALAFILPGIKPEPGSDKLVPCLQFPLAARTGWPVALLTILFFRVY